MNVLTLENRPDDAGGEPVSPLVRASHRTFDANITDCAVLFDDDHTAFGFGDGSVQVVRVPERGGPETTGSESVTLALHEVACVAIERFGNGFVSAGQDGRVMVVPDIAAPAPFALWQSEGDWIETIAVHETPGLVAVASRNTVRVFRDRSEVFHHTFDSTISGLAFDHGGNRVIASHYGGATIGLIDSGAVDLRLEWKGSHIGVSWSPDDRFVVTATQEKELHVWDLVTLEDFRIGGYPRKIHQMDWMADGSKMVCSGTDAITAWPLSGAGPAGRIPLEIGFAFAGIVSAVKAHPASDFVAGGFSTGNILIGATGKGEAVVARARTGAAVSSLSWSPSGDLLVAGDVAGNATWVRVPADLRIR